MNKDKLSQMCGKRVKVRPVARRIDGRCRELNQIDEIWMIVDASRNTVTLRSTRSHQSVTMGTDHIREFMTDSDLCSQSDGFLLLKSQIFLLSPGGFTVEPL